MTTVTHVAQELCMSRVNPTKRRLLMQLKNYACQELILQREDCGGPIKLFEGQINRGSYMSGHLLSFLINELIKMI